MKQTHVHKEAPTPDLLGKADVMRVKAESYPFHI